MCLFSMWSNPLIAASSSSGYQSLLTSAVVVEMGLYREDLLLETNNYCVINEEKYDRVRDDLDE